MDLVSRLHLLEVHNRSSPLIPAEGCSSTAEGPRQSKLVVLVGRWEVVVMVMAVALVVVVGGAQGRNMAAVGQAWG